MIHVEDLTFSVGKFRMDQLSLSVDKGEYFVFLGKPGSGKSILLECLCGLNTPDSGNIYIGGKEVTGVEPRKRGIGYVPQDYALFSHLSVERNISFGLHRQRLSSEEISSRVEQNASMLGITHLLKRRVAGLSGGEKQRTALARALAIEPRVLLLDEPVSALDENTRESVCMELHRLQRELGITTIHVSHNLEEAFSVADRGAILRDGSVEQIGTPEELLHQPSNHFVAQFMRCGNLYSGLAKSQGPEPDTTSVDVGGVEIVVPGTHHGNIEFIIRPENVKLQKANSINTSTHDTQIPVRVTKCVNRGTYVRVNCSGPLPISVHLLHNSLRDMALSEGEELSAVIPLRRIHVLD